MHFFLTNSHYKGDWNTTNLLKGNQFCAKTNNLLTKHTVKCEGGWGWGVKGADGYPILHNFLHQIWLVCSDRSSLRSSKPLLVLSPLLLLHSASPAGLLLRKAIIKKLNFVETNSQTGGWAGLSDFIKPYFVLKSWKDLCLLFLLAGSNELCKCGH